MDNQASIYNEKKLAFFESTYRETVLSKPQEVNVTITPEHIYGQAYICDQTGTREEDPVYSRFTCGLEEITKIYINNNNRNSPIYVQCDDTSKSVMNRRRIILPCFKNNSEIVQMIENAKSELDKKLEVRRESEKTEKLKNLRKAADDEFESMTSGYEEFKKSLEKNASKEESKQEAKSEPAPSPKEEAKPAPAPAPKREPKIAPAPPTDSKSASVKDLDAAASNADTVFEEKERVIPEPENKGSVTVDDILDLNEFLGIKPDMMDAVEAEPDEKDLESIPVEVLQKKPAEIEDLVVPDITGEIKEAKIVTKPTRKSVEPAIEELDPAAEIAKKLTPKAAANKKPAPKQEESEKKPEIIPAAPADEEILPRNGEDVSLDDFETAVKKLKTMLDNGVISESEFAQEKRKLLNLLY
ncbi:MAG: SHOCT domain-containing protein [Oscillospiraceae bacterium]|nr:SHOCT domain-containing protein [Oscillospiraceae bacterium]